MNNNDKKDFVFERDTGIEFQHAKPSEQPFKLSKNQFTVIPKLESVMAEEYNKKFEEMRKAMPKNLAYVGKFGKESIIPPGVSAKKPQPKIQDTPEIKNEPASKNTFTPAVEEAVTPPPPKNITNTPVQPKNEPEPKPAPVQTKEPEKPPVQDDPIVFYTGYESEKDPFNDDTYKNQEFVIENGNKPKNSSFADKIKQTFHKLFSNSAEEDEFDNYNDDE